MGGVNVRLFASEHPDDVAGMVLVDAMVDPSRYWAFVPPAELAKFRVGLEKLPEGLDFDTLVTGAADARASIRSLGHRPLVVLTRGKEDEVPWASEELSARMLSTWQEMQSDLPHLSSNAVHVVARKSGHFIQLDAPRLVVAAVAEVVKASRANGSVNEGEVSRLAAEGL
jgi:pimeloyl-ACP methyl ester carboxylesterase